jgi:hypothetical protein
MGYRTNCWRLSKDASHEDGNSTLCEKHGESHGHSHEDRMENWYDGPAKTLLAEAATTETAEPSSKAAQQWCAPTPIRNDGFRLQSFGE